MAARRASLNLACRNLTLGDWLEACALYGALATGSTLPENPRDAFAAVLDHPGTCVVGALHEGRAVSMVTLHILPNLTYQARPYALIENVATYPEHRHAGYGRCAMEGAIARARSAGAYKVMFWTGLANEAEGFYLRLGSDATEKRGMILRLDP